MTTTTIRRTLAISQLHPGVGGENARVLLSITSPCVAICEYDGEGYCKGCARDADEIRDWMIMTREQKLALLDVLAERRKQSGRT